MKRQPEPKLIPQELPNQPVILYEGFAELCNQNQIVEGNGFVKLTWHPYPRISFKFVYSGHDRIDLDNQRNIELKLTELVPQYRLKVYHYLTQWSGATNNTEITGFVAEPLIKGYTDELASVVFYITNFPCFDISNSEDEDEDYNDWLFFNLSNSNRFTFKNNNWRITLGNLDYNYEFQQILEAEGGYGITHICKIDKLDNSSFSLEEVYPQIEAFCYYLSFARGLWIAPILVSGFNVQGDQVFEEWRTPLIKADSWEKSYVWPDILFSTEIVQTFSGFMEKWEDNNWQEVIKNSIQWYIESLKVATFPNTSIILIQAALEKIAWTFLNSTNCISPSGFLKLTFDDKIRLTLKYLGIEEIDLSECSNLEKIAKERNWLNSINAMNEIRNLIVHPKINKSNNNIEISEKIMIETHNLAFSYLLKCLLKIFNYHFLE
ncbi:hypothetical protein [Planktothrix agardhii]|jgi:hypothetical protein|uniref:hypothetical protein n=1 Tax=Planktothrix agardhii TaxID=1160 RepID=UPI0020A7B78D|nr:hypothetical protein [Planktothrix agardhii]CAD5985178.1 hypothetical protein NO365_04475 [Planktothrix agardhii]